MNDVKRIIVPGVGTVVMELDHLAIVEAKDREIEGLFSRRRVIELIQEFSGSDMAEDWMNERYPVAKEPK